MLRRLLKFLLISIGLLLITGAAFTGMIYAGFYGDIPTSSELKEIRNATASLILDRSGEDLGRIFAENRTNAGFEEFPDHLVNALVATEDARFFEHEGIDPRSVARVLVKTILLGDRSAGGGSTLSQQLAKNLYGRGGDGVLALAVSKLKEMIIATRLEEVYSKDQLVELYLNTVPFSENIYGIETASERFFNQPVAKLQPHQSAVLVGMLKANTYYNPRLHPENALDRRNVVLSQMERYDYLDDSERDSLMALPLDLDYFNPAREGLAEYYLDQVKRDVSTILTEQGYGDQYIPSTDGLRIYTTLDRNLQVLAELAYNRHLNKLQNLFDVHWGDSNPWGEDTRVLMTELKKSRAWSGMEEKGLSQSEILEEMKKVSPKLLYYPGGDTVMNISALDSVTYYLRLLRSGFVALDPNTGAVLSWIGGRDFGYMPYDHVLARRQAASTFKPVVFAAALEAGIEPCTYWENELREYPEYEEWTPRNYDNVYGGFYSMAGALKKSVNVATVQALFEVGLEPVYELSQDLGFSPELPRHPSLALGAGSVSPLELAAAYAVFANGGIYREPYLIERIVTADGKILYEQSPREESRVLSEESAMLMNYMLKKVVEEGTARSLSGNFGVQAELAGKTGTSQDYSDAWFVTYNPNIVAAVWVGGSYPSIRFRSGAYGSSSKQALPMLAYWFREIENNRKAENYLVPFPDLTEQWQSDLDCPDFREKNILDDIMNIFDKKEGKKLEQGEEKPGLFQRLFGKKKK